MHSPTSPPSDLGAGDTRSRGPLLKGGTDTCVFTFDLVSAGRKAAAERVLCGTEGETTGSLMPGRKVGQWSGGGLGEGEGAMWTSTCTDSAIWKIRTVVSGGQGHCQHADGIRCAASKESGTGGRGGTNVVASAHNGVVARVGESVHLVILYLKGREGGWDPLSELAELRDQTTGDGRGSGKPSTCPKGAKWPA